MGHDGQVVEGQGVADATAPLAERLRARGLRLTAQRRRVNARR